LQVFDARHAFEDTLCETDFQHSVVVLQIEKLGFPLLDMQIKYFYSLLFSGLRFVKFSSE
jgi:hypothetical protein